MMGLRSICVLCLGLLFTITSCSLYSPKEDPKDPDPQKDLPVACQLEFAQQFSEPFLAQPGTVQEAKFSADCSKLLTIDYIESRLRVIDLVNRSTIELQAGVHRANFAKGGDWVWYTIYEDSKTKLFVAKGKQIHQAEPDVEWGPILSPDGTMLAYLVDFDWNSLVGSLRLLKLEQFPPEPVELAVDVEQSPRFTPDSKNILFQTNLIAHEPDSDSCFHRVADLKAASTKSGAIQTVAHDISHFAYKPALDSEHVYAMIDYNCEDHSYTMVRISLDGHDFQPIVTGVSDLFWYMEFVEIPERNQVVYLNSVWNSNPGEDPRVELWVSNTDGSEPSVLADDCLSIWMCSMYFKPFTMASDDRLVYIQDDGEYIVESSRLMAVDLKNGNSWLVTDTLKNLYYEVSPNGRWVVTQRQSESKLWDLLITPIDGGETRVLAAEIVRMEKYPGHSSWIASSDRFIAVEDFRDGSPRSVYSFEPQSGERRLIADDVVADSCYDAYFETPEGWLIAVQRESGLSVQAIP
jgi:hypothetical protein